MDQIEKMKSGQLYVCTDELSQIQSEYLEKVYDYNATRPSEYEKRQEILKGLLAEMGDNCYIEPPLHANWGCNTHLGKNVYANFNLTLVDDTDIYIGDYTMIAPNVVIATAGHPILPEFRENIMQYNIPVKIGRNVWIGSGSIILPGVEIGDNSVIGAGSVVTKNIPENCVAFGNPCTVRRSISEHDREYYFKDRKIDPSLFEK